MECKSLNGFPSILPVTCWNGGGRGEWVVLEPLSHGVLFNVIYIASSSPFEGDCFPEESTGDAIARFPMRNSGLMRCAFSSALRSHLCGFGSWQKVMTGSC